MKKFKRIKRDKKMSQYDDRGRRKIISVMLKYRHVSRMGRI